MATRDMAASSRAPRSSASTRARLSLAAMYSGQGSPGFRGIFGSGSARGRSASDRESVSQLVLMYSRMRARSTASGSDTGCANAVAAKTSQTTANLSGRDQRRVIGQSVADGLCGEQRAAGGC
jgi:hypothetical protein